MWLGQVTLFLCSSTQRILKQKRLCCHRDKYLFGSWISSDGGMNPFRASPRPHPILTSSNLSQASHVTAIHSWLMSASKTPSCPAFSCIVITKLCQMCPEESLSLVLNSHRQIIRHMTCGPDWFSGPLTRVSGSSFLHLFNVSNDFSCTIKPMLPCIKPFRGSSLCLEITSLCPCTR